MAKKTLVRLVNSKYGMKDDFEISHAERLLRMVNNGGWELPADSNFKFDIKNGIEHRGHKKTDRRTPETETDK